MNFSLLHQPIKKLVMSPILQKGLKILQMPQFELDLYLEEESEKNPLLEWNKPHQHLALTDAISLPCSLQDKLLTQARDTFDTRAKFNIASYLIGHINAHGYLLINPQSCAKELKIEEKEIRNIIKALQTFDPPGVGAKDLRECLLIQLIRRKKENSLSFQIIQKHFDDLLHGRFSLLQKKLRVSCLEIQKELDQNVKLLYMRPGSSYQEIPVQTVIPDLKIDEKGHIQIYDPRSHLYFREDYSQLKQNPQIKIWKKEANALYTSLEKRGELLTKVAKYIYQHQKNFILSKSTLKGLFVKDAAQTLQIHESTLLRTLNHKYLECPLGTFRLRYFFSHQLENSHCSKQSALNALKRLIDCEEKNNPLSDESIKQALSRKGIHLSRRCITKYRNKLSIPSRLRRKKRY